MKANELRIGNWYDENGTPRQVTPNTIEELWVSERKWIKPIPLTEEWLLKFGLKQSDADKKRFYILRTDIYIFNESKIFFNAGSSNLSVQLYYVHQLQNLYFAFTGKELELKKSI